MGRSNRTAALKSKIMFLMGEHESKLMEIGKAAISHSRSRIAGNSSTNFSFGSLMNR